MSGRRAAGWLVARACVAATTLSLTLVAPAPALSPRAFRHCPTSDPAMIEHGGGLCVFARSGPSSSLVLDGIPVPLVRPIVLQGGTWLEPGGAPAGFVAAEGAATIEPVTEPVPGGLAAVVDRSRLSGDALAVYEALIASGRANVYATVELAGPATAIQFSFTNLLAGTAVALKLPVKVRLSAPFGLLGTGCYLGSDTSPIEVRLTDGTTTPPPPFEPVTGRIGSITENKSEVVTVTENTLVENDFPVPGAEGCGAPGLDEEMLDASINSRLGLPASAGTSLITLESLIGAAAGSQIGQG